MHFGTPHPFFLAQSICFAKERGVVYLNNAKAGCSTIREAMILAQRVDEGTTTGAPLTAREVHGRHSGWSQAIDAIGPDTRVFSVVRNPFTRLLSAYLDKIARRNAIRFQYVVSRRLPQSTEVSFPDFLRTLDRDRNLAVTDQHYRPQVENLHLGSLAPTRIHYLENLSQSAGELCHWLDWSLPFALRDGHGTGARAKIAQFYDDETAEIVRRVHADDFRAFGYSTDLADAAEAPQAWMDHRNVDHDARRAIDIAISRSDARAALASAREPNRIERMLMLGRPGMRDADSEMALTSEIRADLPRMVGSERAIALIALSRIAAQRGDDDMAAHMLQQLLLICPYLSGERFRLAEHLIALGRLDAAKAQRFALQHGSWRKDLVQQLRERLGEIEPVPLQG